MKVLTTVAKDEMHITGKKCVCGLQGEGKGVRSWVWHSVCEQKST